ncbi:MAG TPA: hypothetical protein VK641_03970, partial [Terriglobales bacterium]|nr:hypothetical protein [Terriglobales bacterium]
MVVAREWWHHGFHESHESILADVFGAGVGFHSVLGMGDEGQWRPVDFTLSHSLAGWLRGIPLGLAPTKLRLGLNSGNLHPGRLGVGRRFVDFCAILEPSPGSVAVLFPPRSAVGFPRA